MIRDYRLMPGLMLRGDQRGRALGRLESIEGRPPDEYAEKVGLYDATPLDPQPGIKLEHNPEELTTRVMDILTPVGFGQRGLLVAPPRAGKTILMQNIARGVHANYPNVELILLLIDERPEEVTDMTRNVPGRVYASSNDNTVEKHLDLAQLIIERCSVVQAHLVGIFIGRAAFDGFEPAEGSPALIALEHQAGLETEIADHISRHDRAATQWAQRMRRVAKLPVLPFVGDMQNAFKLCCLHQNQSGSGDACVARLQMRCPGCVLFAGLGDAGVAPTIRVEY